MYVRFVTPRASCAARADRGLFGPAYWFRDNRGAPQYLRDAIADEIDWFRAYLPVPDRFGVVTRRSQRPYAGICWYRDNARNAIAHSHALRWLLAECDLPTGQIVTDYPGDIVYRDDQQIVAMPRPGTPVRWR